LDRLYSTDFCLWWFAFLYKYGCCSI